MKPKRVRFAPSPTGIPHIGNIRTALFDWLLARQSRGQFIVRIEDTDRKRFNPQSLGKILEILRFLGLDWDEGPEIGGPNGPYFQSQRLELYRKIAEELVNKGAAYYCFCSPERLEKIRKEQREKGEIPRYDRCCLSLSKKEIKEKKRGGKYVIRLKMPDDRVFSWQDLIQGEIKINSNELDDQVLLKSDGYPTYHLAVVVDDHYMKITHILRGVEWISSTPKHLAIYEALGWPVPQIAHLPLILGPDKTKLSKRHGAKSILDYRDQGYLKEAQIKFMVYLGWSYKDNAQRVSLKDLVKVFNVKNIQKQNCIFDVQKLDWFNGQYIRMKSDEELAELLKSFVPKNADKKTLLKIIPLIKERIVKLSDFDQMAGFFFKQPKVSPSLMAEDYKKYLREALKALQSIKVWTGPEITKALMKIIKDNNWKTGDFFMAFRIALTGHRQTPPINDSAAILGKKEILSRLSAILNVSTRHNVSASTRGA